MIDAFAPIPRGGAFEIVGPLGTGLSSVALEVALRLHDRSEVDIYLAGTERSGERGRGSSLVVAVWRRYLANRVVAIAAADGMDVLRGLVDDGSRSRDRLVMIDRQWMVAAGASRRDVLDLARVGPPAVSVGVFAPHIPGLEDPNGTCDDVFSSVVGHEKLARAGMSPAISVLASRTRLPQSGAVLRAREVVRRARDIEIYLTQGLYVNSASEGAHPGTWVDSAGAREDLEILAAEGASDVSLYAGRLRPVTRDV